MAKNSNRTFESASDVFRFYMPEYHRHLIFRDKDPSELGEFMAREILDSLEKRFKRARIPSGH